jgi:hypothetical protein
MLSWVLAAYLFIGAWSAGQEPTARALVERYEKEKSPVCVDGDTATFFYRGEVEQVALHFSGERIAFRRLPDSVVWTAMVTKPGMAKGDFTYAIVPGKKGEPPSSPCGCCRSSGGAARRHCRPRRAPNL